MDVERERKLLSMVRAETSVFYCFLVFSIWTIPSGLWVLNGYGRLPTDEESLRSSWKQKGEAGHGGADRRVTSLRIAGATW